MKGIRYEMISQTDKAIHSESYGIRCINSGTEEMTINDISTNREEVIRLVDLCNTQKVSLLHIHDVIDDFIG